jgi:indolepyruvate ferredoxin oxidoreductase
LRGTALDIFGYTAERKLERRDIKDYRELMQHLAESVDAENYALAVQLAELPLQMRGYGHVKDANRHKLALQRKPLLEKFRGENVVKFVEKVA